MNLYPKGEEGGYLYSLSRLLPAGKGLSLKRKGCLLEEEFKERPCLFAFAKAFFLPFLPPRDHNNKKATSIEGSDQKEGKIDQHCTLHAKVAKE